MTNQEVSLRGPFCTVLTLHGPGDIEQPHRQSLLRTKGSRAQVSGKCGICSLPRMPGYRKVTEGNVEVFVGQYVGVRSGNFLVITPLKGNLGDVAATPGKPTPSDLIEKSEHRRSNYGQ